MCILSILDQVMWSKRKAYHFSKSSLSYVHGRNNCDKINCLIRRVVSRRELSPRTGGKKTTTTKKNNTVKTWNYDCGFLVGWLVGFFFVSFVGILSFIIIIKCTIHSHWIISNEALIMLQLLMRSQSISIVTGSCYFCYFSKVIKTYVKC